MCLSRINGTSDEINKALSVKSQSSYADVIKGTRSLFAKRSYEIKNSAYSEYPPTERSKNIGLE